MRRVLSALALVLALIVVAPQADPQERRANGWSERGLFIFSPGYFFDFWRQRAGIYGAHVQSSLTDCSTADHYCLSEGWFTIAVPRVCPSLEIGQTWTVADVTMRVIARVTTFRDPHHDPDGQGAGWIIVADGRPNAAYLYDPPYGIKTIYMAASTVDLRAIAEAGRIDEEGNGVSRMHLISPDSFGWCRS